MIARLFGDVEKKVTRLFCTCFWLSKDTDERDFKTNTLAYFFFVYLVSTALFR